MKTLKKIFYIFVLIFLYVFVLSRNYIPVTVAVKGEEVRISNIQVIPIGEVVGIKLYTSGVLVVGTSGIESIDGKTYKPYENTEIREGDSIISINDNIINSTQELIDTINMYNGETVKITYIRDNVERICDITPVKDKVGMYKIGLWVRDSAAGVGTVTFYNEETQSFAALGHAITDIDTGEILQTSSGEIDNVSIVSVIKGKEEEPGKIQGAINQNSVIGNIYKNTAYGVYGVIKNPDNINIRNIATALFTFMSYTNNQQKSLYNKIEESKQKSQQDFDQRDANIIAYIEEIKGNEEVLNMLSIDRLKKLEKYYDSVIAENEKKIRKLKATE